METTLPEDSGENQSLQAPEFIQHFPMTADPGSSQDPSSSKRKAGRRKIPIEFIEDKSRRQITFSKRKAGLMKKVFIIFMKFPTFSHPSIPRRTS